MESRILCFKFRHIGKKPSQRYCLQLNLGFSKKMAGKWDLEKSGLDSGIHAHRPSYNSLANKNCFDRMRNFHVCMWKFKLLAFRAINSALIHNGRF